MDGLLALSRRGVSTRGSGLLLAPLPLALLVAILLAVAYGSVGIPARETLEILAYKLGLTAGHRTWSGVDENIIWQIRLPRVLAAALVGASLSVAGALFQAVLRNPLADPYVIGTSAGAQLGVMLALLLPLQFAVAGFGSIQVAGFICALLTVLLVYGLARTAGTTPIVTLLLAGFVISSFLISATTFLMLVSNRTQQVMMWTMGSLDVSEMTQLGITAPAIVAASLTALFLAPQLDVMLLGEEHAMHLGVRVERLKVTALVLASLLTALAVTLAGVVAFVGLVVPHAARLLYGPGHRVMIPAAAVIGAVFVVVADLVARIGVGGEQVPLGIVTAVIGAPFFLHLLRKGRRTYGL